MPQGTIARPARAAPPQPHRHPADTPGSGPLANVWSHQQSSCKGATCELGKIKVNAEILVRWSEKRFLTSYGLQDRAQEGQPPT